MLSKATLMAPGHQGASECACRRAEVGLGERNNYRANILMILKAICSVFIPVWLTIVELNAVLFLDDNPTLLSTRPRHHQCLGHPALTRINATRQAYCKPTIYRDTSGRYATFKA